MWGGWTSEWCAKGTGAAGRMTDTWLCHNEAVLQPGVAAACMGLLDVHCQLLTPSAPPPPSYPIHPIAPLLSTSPPNNRRKLLPLLMAHYPLGEPGAPPAAEWMYAALKMHQQEARVAPGSSHPTELVQVRASSRAWLHRGVGARVPSCRDG